MNQANNHIKVFCEAEFIIEIILNIESDECSETAMLKEMSE